VKKAAPAYWLLLLLTCAFTLGTVLQPRTTLWSPRAEAGSLLKVMLGDGRSLFADFFARKADISFHSGYYPSIFDQAKAPKDTRHMTSVDPDEADGHSDHDHEAATTTGEPHKEAAHEDHDAAHEQAMNFLGPPSDIFERFGRRFMITEHAHLEGGDAREILPWLKVAADLDPHRIETYTVASYWLRNRLKKPAEAEKFLREGLKENPDSYEILAELGAVYYQNLKETARARNVWELALKKWDVQESGKKEPDTLGRVQILDHLALLEETEGNYSAALDYLKKAQPLSPSPQAIQRQIDELSAKVK
jgi:hypothetical protein